MENLSDEQLTEIYKKANNIPDGKLVPITSENIFRAMRATHALNESKSENENENEIEDLLKEALWYVTMSTWHLGNHKAEKLKERIEKALL